MQDGVIYGQDVVRELEGDLPLGYVNRGGKGMSYAGGAGYDGSLRRTAEHAADLGEAVNVVVVGIEQLRNFGKLDTGDVKAAGEESFCGVAVGNQGGQIRERSGDGNAGSASGGQYRLEAQRIRIGGELGRDGVKLVFPVGRLEHRSVGIYARGLQTPRQLPLGVEHTLCIIHLQATEQFVELRFRDLHVESKLLVGVLGRDGDIPLGPHSGERIGGKGG